MQHEASADSEKLYFDDLHVGQRFASHEQTLDEEQIRAFARQFDPQPFHLDEEAGKHSLFTGMVASGWHTAAITMRLIVDSVPIAGGVIGLGGEISWPGPVRPGTSLHLETEVLETRASKSRPDRGIVTLQCQTINDHGETVQKLVTTIVVPRKT
jgi:acyl dehydratase